MFYLLGCFNFIFIDTFVLSFCFFKCFLNFVLMFTSFFFKFFGCYLYAFFLDWVDGWDEMGRRAIKRYSITREKIYVGVPLINDCIFTKKKYKRVDEETCGGGRMASFQWHIAQYCYPIWKNKGWLMEWEWKVVIIILTKI